MMLLVFYVYYYRLNANIFILPHTHTARTHAHTRARARVGACIFTFQPARGQGPGCSVLTARPLVTYNTLRKWSVRS